VKTLVTGAAGFIGSHLVDHLLARGDDVIGVDNFDPYYSPAEKRRNLEGALASGRFELIEQDIADGAALVRALRGRGFDAIVHLAAKVGVRPSVVEPVQYARTNVLGTQVLLDLARDRGVGSFICASSSSVYGNGASLPFAEAEETLHPASPYAATKRAGELLCQAHQQLHGGRFACLRFFTVYGPRQRPDLAIRKFLSLILARRPIPVFGDGLSERDYTWVGDTVAGIVAALDHATRVPSGFEIINLGTGRSTSLGRLIQIIGETVGIEPIVAAEPAQPGDLVRTQADTTRARRVLKWVAGTTLEQGIARYAESLPIPLTHR
jgi:UDP-glucuronate 4-epimerase